MAESFGIDTIRVRYFNFFIGSALAGAAGMIVGILNNLVEPTMGSVPSYKALAIIVLGGLGSVRGTLVAALALGVVESYGTIYLGNVLNRDAIAFVFFDPCVDGASARYVSGILRWDMKSVYSLSWVSASSAV